MLDNDKVELPKISLRDYFAGQALSRSQGLVSPDLIAAVAYDIADAMLAERERAK